MVYGPGRDPLRFFSDLQRTYGNLVHVRMAGEHLFLVNDPRHVRDILGILRISRAEIDMPYIADWARRLGLAEVWESIVRRAEGA